jgi:hypothetical protein
LELQTIVANGDMIDVYGPQSDSQMRWLNQVRFTGDDPVLEAYAKRGWELYNKTPKVPYYTMKFHQLQQKFRDFMWDRPKLVGYVYKYKMSRNTYRYLAGLR